MSAPDSEPEFLKFDPTDKTQVAQWTDRIFLIADFIDVWISGMGDFLKDKKDLFNLYRESPPVRYLGTAIAQISLPAFIETIEKPKLRLRAFDVSVAGSIILNGVFDISAIEVYVDRFECAEVPRSILIHKAMDPVPVSIYAGNLPAFYELVRLGFPIPIDAPRLIREHFARNEGSPSAAYVFPRMLKLLSNLKKKDTVTEHVPKIKRRRC